MMMKKGESMSAPPIASWQGESMSESEYESESESMSKMMMKKYERTPHCLLAGAPSL